MDVQDLIYGEVKAMRAEMRTFDDRLDRIEKGIAVDRVKHGIIGAIAASLVAIVFRMPDWLKWLSK